VNHRFLVVVSPTRGKVYAETAARLHGALEEKGYEFWNWVPGWFLVVAATSDSDAFVRWLRDVIRERKNHCLVVSLEENSLETGRVPPGSVAWLQEHFNVRRDETDDSVPDPARD